VLLKANASPKGLEMVFSVMFAMGEERSHGRVVQTIRAAKADVSVWTTSWFVPPRTRIDVDKLTVLDRS
jgi:hypothetical protein